MSGVFSLAVAAQIAQPGKTLLPEIESAEKISVETSLVNVPVSVFDKKGDAIYDLKQTDFKIYENGIEQKIEYFAATEQPFTVILLLDISGSMRDHIGDIKRAALSFIDQLNPRDRISVMTFNTSLRVLNKNLTDRENLRRAIHTVEGGGGTNLYPIVELVSGRVLKKIQGRKALVLFTDGIDIRGVSDSFNSTYATSLREAEASGALVYSVQYNGDTNISSNVADSYLADLTYFTGGRLFRAKSHKDLIKNFTSIANELRRQYSIGYYPEIIAKPNERREIKVQVNRQNVSIQTRDSYVGK